MGDAVPELRIRMLGGLDIEVGGRPRDLPALRRARSLLAYLALHPGTHPRGTLAARFWPHVRDQSARSSLRTALSDLRRSLGDVRALDATRDEVTLAGAWTDVGEFERLAAEGARAEALALYRGPLLSGLDDEWVYERRDELRDRAGELLAALAADAEAAGDLAAAIERTRSWAALDPLDEEPVRALIRRLAAAGDRADAIAAYDRLSERLRSQLAIAPSAATRAAAQAARTEPVGVEGMPAPVAAAELDWMRRDAPAISLPAPLVDAGRTRLVGRAGELARLRELWALARGGRPQVVMLAGEPGIGKTRLAAELARAAHADDGALVLFGRCDEVSLTPYQPFVEALDRYVADVAGDELRAQVGDDREPLARLVPAIARSLGGPAFDGPSPNRFVLFEAFARLLIEAARARPAIAVLDDLHWADEPTLLLLPHVVRELRDAPLLLTCTYRATELAGAGAVALASIRRLAVIEELELGGLDADEVGELVAARAGGAAVDVAGIYERSEGNPYFVEELVRAREDEGVPRRVEDLIRRRLDRLGESEAAALAAAAVAGAEFDASVVATATGQDLDALIGDLERAVEAGVLREVSAAPGRFAFAHALVREIVYGSVSAARRARLHQRIGETLEAGGAAAATLAHHFTAAGDQDRAFGHAIAAARAARAVAAVEAAGRHYDVAVGLARRAERDAAGDAAVRDLLIERAALRHQRADFAGAVRDAEAALVGARTAGDRRAEMRARSELGYARRETDVAAALPHHEAALAIAHERGDAHAEVAMLSRIALLHTVRLELDAAVVAGDRALALARANGSPALVARALDALKLAALWLGELDRLEDLVAELLVLLGDEQPWYRGFALMEAAFVPIARRQPELAEERLSAAGELARRSDSAVLISLVEEAAAWFHREQGELDRAIAEARSGLERISRRGSQFAGSIAATLATALLERGDPEAAAAELERGLAVAGRLGAPGEILRCAGQLAHARLLCGDAGAAAAAAAEAERVLARATLPAGATPLLCAHGSLGAARVRLAEGDARAARSLAEPVLAAAERVGWAEFAQAAAPLLAGYPSGQNTS